MVRAAPTDGPSLNIPIPHQDQQRHHLIKKGVVLLVIRNVRGDISIELA